MTGRKFVVHGLKPMTTAELGRLRCGHCRHRLTLHITFPSGATQCGICHCFRRANEDILEPHDFAPAQRTFPPDSQACLTCGYGPDLCEQSGCPGSSFPPGQTP